MKKLMQQHFQRMLTIQRDKRQKTLPSDRRGVDSYDRNNPDNLPVTSSSSPKAFKELVAMQKVVKNKYESLWKMSPEKAQELNRKVLKELLGRSSSTQQHRQLTQTVQQHKQQNTLQSDQGTVKLDDSYHRNNPNNPPETSPSRPQSFKELVEMQKGATNKGGIL